MNCTIRLRRSASATSSATARLTLDAAHGTRSKDSGGVETDSGAGGLSEDCSNGPTGGVACVPCTSDRCNPQWLQKFAWLRFTAEQRGHCIGNLTPQTSQK